MYHSQFIPTYMFYDPSLCTVNPICRQYIVEKNATANANATEEVNDSTTTIHYSRLKDDDDSDDEFTDENYNEFTSKYLYENEILYAFHMNNFDEELINSKIKALYEYITSIRTINSSANSLLEFSTRAASDIISCSDEHSGFILLFSYQFFHITHLCIIDLLNEDKLYTISQINMDALENSVNLFIDK
jgi:hypothetical protein